MFNFFKRKTREQIRYRHIDEAFGPVVVADQGRIRHLKFGNRVKQGSVDLKNPDAIYLKYQQMMLTVFDGGRYDRCLCLGLGAGSIPRYIHRNRLCRRLEVVEINPVVVDVARTYFDLPEEITVHHTDAADFVAATEQRFDLVFVDLFNQSGMPAAFKELSFYRRLYGRLTPNGAVVVNMWSSDFSNLLLEEMLDEVFDELRIVRSRRSKNHIAIGERTV